MHFESEQLLCVMDTSCKVLYVLQSDSGKNISENIVNYLKWPTTNLPDTCTTH